MSHEGLRVLGPKISPCNTANRGGAQTSLLVAIRLQQYSLRQILHSSIAVVQTHRCHPLLAH